MAATQKVSRHGCTWDLLEAGLLRAGVVGIVTAPGPSVYHREVIQQRHSLIIEGRLGQEI